MDEEIHVFIENLRKQLDSIPAEEVREAVGYYEEYLSDAAEAGKDINEILLQFGPPEKIAAEIKAEAAISHAQRNPGLKNFTNALRYAFHGITTPFAFLFAAIFVIISYSLVITFFAGASVIFAGAFGVIFAAIYEAASIPPRFMLEILGTIGMGLLCSGIFMLISLGLYKLSRLMIIASAGIIRKFRKTPSAQIQEKSNGGSIKKSGVRRPVLAFLIVTAAGFALFSISGLPYRYFTIFNSMKPQNTIMRTMEYSTDKINKISVITAHSHIRLEHGTSQKITVSYEQPDWLDYECGVSGSMLSFYEKSNGRFSLFNLISLHESRTEVTISFPAGYSPEIVTLESTGGYVLIKDITENIQIKTYTGDITLDNKNVKAGSFNVKAATGTGFLDVNGAAAGRKTGYGTEYFNSTGSGKTIDIKSSRGNISIL